MEPVGETNTKLHPFRCICHLEMKGLEGEAKSGSGWFVGPRTIITAAHNLRQWLSPFTARTMRVSAGQHGMYGSVWSGRAQWQAMHPGWDATENPEFDVAAIWLDERVDQLGVIPIAAFPPPQLTGARIKVAGYPQTMPEGVQAVGHGTLTQVRGLRIDHDIATAQGVSGGPVWVTDDQNLPWVVGIHTNAKTEHATEAVLITDDLAQQIKQWRDA